MTKQLNLSRLALGLAFGGLAFFPAVGADSARVGSYDFSYVSSGDTRARPVQVFDDGRNTFFQFRSGEAVPAIFSSNDGVPELVVPANEGPYVRVPSVRGRFLLQVGRAQAHVIHVAGGRSDAPAIAAVSPSGITQPYAGGALPRGGHLVASLAPVVASTAADQAVDRNSYATPLKGDRVYWSESTSQTEHGVSFSRGAYVLSAAARKTLAQLVSAAPPGSRFVAIGRDDDTYKEGLEQARADAIRSALIKAGVDHDRVSTRTGVMRKGKANQWDSTLVVESQVSAPPMRMAQSTPLAGGNPNVVANVEALLRSGVLDEAQAQALLRRHNVPRAAPAPTRDVPENGFTLTKGDKTVQGAIRRWAAALAYEVVWEAPAHLDAPIAGDATIAAPNLGEALGRLLRGLKEKGYTLEATIYANRVIRITKSTVPPPAVAPITQPPAPPSASTQIGTANAGANQQWQMLAGDRTVAATLARWGEAAQWNVVWTAKDQVPVTGSAVVHQPDFKTAADYVMQQVAAAGYRVRATAQGDKTLLVSNY
jgi:hypothetical protein